MAKTDTANAPLEPGDRVTATRDLRGVLEGSSGTIHLANGLTWLRFWVKWDTGYWQGSVSGADLVRAGAWEEFKRRRAEEASRPPAAAVTAASAAAAGDAEPAAAGGAAANSRVPAHLLERSQKARARKAVG